MIVPGLTPTDPTLTVPTPVAPKVTLSPLLYQVVLVPSVKFLLVVVMSQVVFVAAFQVRPVMTL